MSFKTVLLSSAAVFIAASDARAADGIAPEPVEPVAYVRVCDAYGEGWWYIPGTESCLKLDGDVRVQYRSLHYHDATSSDDETSFHDSDYRGRLNVRANSETELGTLASRIRFVGSGGSDDSNHYDELSVSEGPSSASVAVDWVEIGLAGMQVGWGDDFWTRGGNYGFYQAQYDGPYGDYDGLFFEYAFAANGWVATAGIEDGDVSGEAGAPDLYAGLSYSNAGWYLAGLAYRDSSADSFAWKVRADYDMSAWLKGLAVGGWYMSDDGRTDYVKGHAFGVTANVNLARDLILFGGYGRYEDGYFDRAGTCGAAGNAACGSNAGYRTWTAGLVWEVVPSLTIQPEYAVTAYDDENGADRRNNGLFNLKVVRTF